METLPGAVISRSWLKKFRLVLQLSNGWGNLFPHPATLHLIYKALIQPHVDYCNVVWGNCGVKLADKLQKLPKSCSASSNFLKLWRRCIRPVPKFKLEKSYYSASYPIKDLNVNLIKIRACEVGSRSQLTFLLLAASWSQQTSDHSDKISLLIANLKVATLRLEFVNNDTTPPLLLYTLLIKLQSLCPFHVYREN